MEELREGNHELEFDSKTMSLLDKCKWTIKLWAGFKTKLKVKVKLIK